MISEEEAIEAARRAASDRGWPWEGRIDVSRTRTLFGRVTYEVRSNADMRGCNSRVIVDAEDGAVREAYWLRR